MILWVVLFVLVLAISFVLAAKSMRDFTELPSKDEEYSLFLIRNTSRFSAKLLNSIHEDLLGLGAVISFERLFKGKKSALVVFGPASLLLGYKDALDLLELEDYTNVNVSHIFAWEAGIKNKESREKIFGSLPQFLETEQFWWQIILSAPFKAQITAVVIAADAVARDTLSQKLQNLAPEKINKLPKAFSNSQMLDFYKKRSFRKDNKNPSLNAEEILQLLLI